MSHRLPENVVAQRLEGIIHAVKVAKRVPDAQREIEVLDERYQRVLGELARFNHPETFSRYLNLYRKHFPGVEYVN